MTTVFYKLRHQTSKLSYIQNFGEYGITRINDISLEYDSKRDTLPEDKSVSPSSEMITFELNSATVMTLRGSGTEPKLKYYIESKGQSMADARLVSEGVENALLATFKDLGLNM